MTEELENAPVETGGAETVASTPEDTTPTEPTSWDDDSSLEAIVDKLSASDDEATAAPDEAAAEPVTDQPQDGEPAPDITPASDAPHSWSAEMKAHWANVPPEARAYIAQREAAAHEQISRMGQEVARYRPIGELIESRQEMFDRNGFAPVDGLQRLFEAQEALERDPVQGLAAIAQSFGIDLAAVFGGQPGQQPDPNAVPPQVQQLTQKISQLEQKLAQRENTERAQAERETQTRREEAKSQVEKWSEGKTHFANDEVRRLMATLMTSGTANDLDDAYDKACHAVPEVRQAILTEKAKADAAKKLAEDAKAAAEAKKARGVNTGSRPGTAASGAKWDDDSYLESVLSRVAG